MPYKEWSVVQAALPVLRTARAAKYLTQRRGICGSDSTQAVVIYSGLMYLSDVETRDSDGRWACLSRNLLTCTVGKMGDES
ncbi:hypothetical protein C8R44DRAFT_761135 [Mycena epipterygia]|nr:hypothetical protein C8R44DRAFT_761135 [Mycena epipterygia]